MIGGQQRISLFTGEEVINLFVSTHIRLMKDGSLDLRAHQGETPGLSGPDP